MFFGHAEETAIHGTSGLLVPLCWEGAALQTIAQQPPSHPRQVEGFLASGLKVPDWRHLELNLKKFRNLKILKKLVRLQ